MPFLKQDIIKRGWVNKKIGEQLEFENVGNNQKYKMEGICNSVLYARELEVGYLLGLY